jgi:hypothetical protein
MNDLNRKFQYHSYSSSKLGASTAPRIVPDYSRARVTPRVARTSPFPGGASGNWMRRRAEIGLPAASMPALNESSFSARTVT